MLFPTTLVGSYPQPEWLIDRKKLAGRFPPRVRARELWRVPEPYLAEAQDDATVLAIRAHPEREHGRMLDEPDLVPRVCSTRGREGLHLPPHVGQRPEAELAQLRCRRVGRHRTSRICGAATRSK